MFPVPSSSFPGPCIKIYSLILSKKKTTHNHHSYEPPLFFASLTSVTPAKSMTMNENLKDDT